MGRVYIGYKPCKVAKKPCKVACKNHLNILVNVVSPTLQGLYHLNILVDPILHFFVNNTISFKRKCHNFKSTSGGPSFLRDCNVGYLFCYQANIRHP